MSVRRLEVLLAEAGRGRLLIVLESSIAIVLITCRCECALYEADSCREYESNVHTGFYKSSDVVRVCLQT